MLSSILIIITAAAFFAYWFRQTCLLILGQKSTGDYAVKVAATIRLSFPSVQQALQTDVQTPELDRLHKSLDQDFRVLTELLHNASGSDSLERRLLTMDYQMMKVWYQLTRTNDFKRARKALAEMSSILCYFADDIGLRAAA